jgi:hypothetical protein
VDRSLSEGPSPLSIDCAAKADNPGKASIDRGSQQWQTLSAALALQGIPNLGVGNLTSF